MKKLPLNISFILSILLATFAFALLIAIFNSANSGIYKQSHLIEALNAKTQIHNQNAGVIKNENALQLNGLNNGTNRFMINEFKNIYRVKA